DVAVLGEYRYRYVRAIARAGSAMTGIYVIGAGGHGVVVAEIAAACGYRVLGFIDDDPTRQGMTVLDWHVLGDMRAIPDGAVVALGIGNSAVRQRLLETAAVHGWQLPV